jgi:hypothetical protein
MTGPAAIIRASEARGMPRGIVNRKAMNKKTKKEKALLFLRPLNKATLPWTKVTNMVIPLLLT